MSTLPAAPPPRRFVCCRRSSSCSVFRGRRQKSQRPRSTPGSALQLMDTHTGRPRAGAAAILTGGRLLPGGVDLSQCVLVSVGGPSGRRDTSGRAGNVGFLVGVLSISVTSSPSAAGWAAAGCSHFWPNSPATPSAVALQAPTTVGSSSTTCVPFPPREQSEGGVGRTLDGHVHSYQRPRTGASMSPVYVRLLARGG